MLNVSANLPPFPNKDHFVSESYLVGVAIQSLCCAIEQYSWCLKFLVSRDVEFWSYNFQHVLPQSYTFTGQVIAINVPTCVSNLPFREKKVNKSIKCFDRHSFWGWANFYLMLFMLYLYSYPHHGLTPKYHALVHAALPWADMCSHTLLMFKISQMT